MNKQEIPLMSLEDIIKNKYKIESTDYDIYYSFEFSPQGIIVNCEDSGYSYTELISWEVVDQIRSKINE